MYINKTTADERVTIDSAIGDVFDKIDRANSLLCWMWEEYFAKAKPEPLTEYDMETVGNLLYTLTDTIFDALLEYALTVGRSDFRGVDPHLDGVKRVQTLFECEAVNDKAYQLHRTHKDGQGILEARRAIMKLPDEQAIPAFEELLKASSK